jgi:hypothetical protein
MQEIGHEILSFSRHLKKALESRVFRPVPPSSADSTAGTPCERPIIMEHSLTGSIPRRSTIDIFNKKKAVCGCASVRPCRYVFVGAL